MALRFPVPTAWLDRTATLAAALALAVLVPTALAVWVLTDAAAAQAEAARRQVAEAHRGQLRLVRSRIDAHWRSQAAGLQGRGDAGQRFARAVLGGVADGLVVFDDRGRRLFPDEAGAASPAALAIDRQLEALAPAAPERTAVDAVAARLNDYGIAMAAAERLARMERLRALAPNVRLPTEAALRLSLALAGSGLPAGAAGHFQPTSVAHVWALPSPDGQVVGLYWTGRLESLMHDLLHQVTPAGIRFIAFPPDVPADADAIAAGAVLPGWQLSYQPLDTTVFDGSAARRASLYVWMGGGTLALVLVLGVTSGRLLRRHLRLARLKTDLAAAVSHELRTPLAAMRVLVDGLLEDGRLDERKTREYLHLLASENSRLSQVIENFLTFARLERGRHFSFTAAAPAAIVAEAVAAVRTPPGCTLRVEVEPDLPPIAVDTTAVTTALVNLLDNAVKYTGADKRIAVRAARDGAFVRFAVEDNGIGIPAREQRRIFRRFYRADARLAGAASGVGLGLSIVDLIARAHGGAVSVTSAAGAGSTFVLRLPVAAGGAAV